MRVFVQLFKAWTKILRLLPSKHSVKELNVLLKYILWVTFTGENKSDIPFIS